MRSLHSPVGQWVTLSVIVMTLATTLGPVRSQPSVPNRATSPAQLRAKMAEIARATHGPVGAAVLVVEGGNIIAWHGEQHLPMQSVYKLPIAMAVLHQVDMGALKLDQSVRVGPGDLVPPSVHSPIAAQYPKGTVMTVSGLLDATIKDSDGTASDVL